MPLHRLGVLFKPTAKINRYGIVRYYILGSFSFVCTGWVKCDERAFVFLRLRLTRLAITGSCFAWPGRQCGVVPGEAFLGFFYYYWESMS
jgi:hypothetical protein